MERTIAPYEGFVKQPDKRERNIALQAQVFCDTGIEQRRLTQSGARKQNYQSVGKYFVA
jgi:hypothetical protein